VIFHVRFTCASDYNERRLPYRPAHLRQLEKLGTEGRVVGGGPEPDGTFAHIFYRVHDRAELDGLLGDNEFNRAGLFVRSVPRAFVDFLEPLERPPLDAGLRVTIVEGVVADRGRALAGLTTLRSTRDVAFGGIFADGAGLAVVRRADVDDARRLVTDAGGWATDSLTTRPWSQTL